MFYFKFYELNIQHNPIKLKYSNSKTPKILEQKHETQSSEALFPHKKFPLKQEQLTILTTQAIF